MCIYVYVYAHIISVYIIPACQSCWLSVLKKIHLFLSINQFVSKAAIHFIIWHWTSSSLKPQQQIFSRCCTVIKTVTLCHTNTVRCSVCFSEPVKEPRVIQPRNKTLYAKPGNLWLNVHTSKIYLIHFIINILFSKIASFCIFAGMEIKLECMVFIGFGEESQFETSVYWMINHSFTDSYPQFQQNLTM